MKKILLPLLILISFFAKAQSPVTMQFAAPNPGVTASDSVRYFYPGKAGGFSYLWNAGLIRTRTLLNQNGSGQPANFWTIGTGEIDAPNLGTSVTPIFSLVNPTAATNILNQNSGEFVLSGNGWGGSSQSVKFGGVVVPINGTSAPDGSLNIYSNINGTGNNLALQISAFGSLGFNNFVVNNGKFTGNNDATGGIAHTVWSNSTLYQTANNDVLANGYFAGTFIANSGLATVTVSNGGASYTNGTYTNVPIVDLTTGNHSVAGTALATVVISGGAIVSITPTTFGARYGASDNLTVAAANVGGTGSGLVAAVNTLHTYTGGKFFDLYAAGGVNFPGLSSITAVNGLGIDASGNVGPVILGSGSTGINGLNGTTNIGLGGTFANNTTENIQTYTWELDQATAGGGATGSGVFKFRNGGFDLDAIDTDDGVETNISGTSQGFQTSKIDNASNVSGFLGLTGGADMGGVPGVTIYSTHNSDGKGKEIDIYTDGTKGLPVRDSATRIGFIYPGNYHPGMLANPHALIDFSLADSLYARKGGSSGTVTTVSGVAANGFTWSIANPTTTPALTLSLQNATTSQSGQLTATDWNTFNGKQAAITTGTTLQYFRGDLSLATFPTGLPPTGTAGGDLTGTYPNPTVNTINSISKSFYDPTSSIQTQLNGKQASGSYLTAIGVTTANGVSGTSSGGTTPNLTITLGVITPTSTNGVSAATMAFNDATSSIQTQLNSKGAGTVTSVSGTTNRITSTGGTTPVIDISASYAGQSSITTVGTLSAGSIPYSLITGAPASGVSSVSNSDGTLTISPTTGAVVASLALGHANSWSGIQTLATPVINGISTGTGVSTAATANSLDLRDANANVFANNMIGGFTTTISSATPITLTVASAQYQQITGTTAQQLILPVVSTLTLGQSFVINNISTATTTVDASNGSSLVVTLPAGASATVICRLLTGVSATSWTVVGNYGFSQGLTATGTSVTLGGTMTSSKTITMSGTPTFTIGGTNSFFTIGSGSGSDEFEGVAGDGTNTAKVLLLPASSEFSYTNATGKQSLIMNGTTTTFTDAANLKGPVLGGQYNATLTSLSLMPKSATDSLYLLKTSVPIGANPSASAGTTAVNGSATTFMRSDGAPKVDSTAFATKALILTYLPKASIVSTYAPLSGNLSQFASTTSAQLRTVLSDESGTGAAIFANGALGAATATSINGNTFTTGTYTLTGTAAKTLTFNNSLTLAGTDATTMTFPSASTNVVGNPNGALNILASTQTTLVAGTKALSITGVTTTSKAYVGYVVKGGTVTTTVKYAAVCTSGTVTVSGLTAADAVDTSDTSTVNVFVTN